MRGCLSRAPYWGPDLVHNPGMCPDWESNQQPFGSQAGTQSTEPHQPGQEIIFNMNKTGGVRYSNCLLLIFNLLTHNLSNFVTFPI